MPPTDWTFNITVFDGIVMYVINVIAEILFITNPMLPNLSWASAEGNAVATFMTASGKHGGRSLTATCWGVTTWYYAKESNIAKAQ